MGLTFKKQDDLEKMLDKFAIMPEDLKTSGKDKNQNEQKKKAAKK
jgi:hypothetical protein